MFVMELRKARLEDADQWARMRECLWAGTRQEHLVKIGSFLVNKSTEIVDAFVLDRGNGLLGGFIEINVRCHTEGALANEVPHIEGWYVDEDLRGQGYGRALFEVAEHWALAHGFTAVASNADISNTDSIDTHKAMGYEEVDRVVHFIKKL